jgi:PAS domain S-box-containing protein
MRNSPIRVLTVEDLPTDAELAERELQKELGQCEFRRVETREGFLQALDAFHPELIVSDFKLPQFDGLAALELARELVPDVPFIMLTGSMNEDTAVDCMKAGAWDYVIKEHVKRLGAAAKGALELQRTRRDRREAELSLRQSEQRLRVAQRLGRIGHWEFDLQTQQLQWSDAVFSIYGRDPLQGPPSAKEEAKYYTSEGARQLRDYAQRTIETGEPFELDASLSLPDGRRVEITTIGSAITDQQGRVMRLLGTVQDITARKRAELALQTERDNLSAVLGAVPTAILVLDEAAQVVRANSAAEKLFGGPRMEFLGKRCGDVLGCVHRDEDQRGCGAGTRCAGCALFGIIRETLEHGRMTHDQEVEVEIEIGAASERHWLVANAGPLTLEEGRGAVLALHDVTDRRHAEELVRFQAMLLESQNEASIDGIWIADETGNTIWSNRRFSELWDLPPELVRPKSNGAIEQFLVDKAEDADACRSQMGKLSANRNAKGRDELRLKDGRTFDRYSAPITDHTATYLGRVWVFRDVTGEKKLQASVAQSDRLASMGMLAAGVAHEINNPLSYILYNLESLIDDLQLQVAQSARLRSALAVHIGEDGLRDLMGANLNLLDPSELEDMQGRFRDALGGTRRIKEIARGLGTFSRVEKDRSSPVELRVTIESAINIAFNEIKYRAQIVKDYGTSARVVASEGRLSQIFLNLLVNAAHSIPDGNVDGNRICVKTWEKDGTVYAEVSDTGCGIPAENLSRIFDPFFTTKPVGVGTGLGLHIVRNILEGYDGTIEVSSEVGKGTRFLIRLPEATTVALTSDESLNADRAAGGVRGRILVVDDESAIRTAIKRILRSHEVVEVDSGEQARELLDRDQEFDVILCDLIMPRVSGIDVHQWLSEHHPQLVRKLIFVTGGAFTPGARSYLEQVDNLSIEKPFDATNLSKMVNGWVLAARANEREE